MTSTMTVVTALDARAQPRRQPGLAPLTAWTNAVIGLSFVAMLPALFWVAVLAATAPVLGVTLSAYALTLTGIAIAFFLAVVCAPVIFKV
jgi:DMSO/TMAO reductase YedYZ heme-binding membrane subunit